MDQQEFERCLIDLGGTPDWIAEQAQSVPADGMGGRHSQR